MSPLWLSSQCAGSLRALAAGDRIEQGQVLCPLHGQWAGTVMQDQLRYAGEGPTVLSQYHLVLPGPCEFQVHGTLVASERQNAVLSPGLAEPNEVAAFLAEGQKVLGLCSAQGAVKPRLLLQGKGCIHTLRRLWSPGLLGGAWSPFPVRTIKLHCESPGDVILLPPQGWSYSSAGLSSSRGLRLWPEDPPSSGFVACSSYGVS